jgi:hypothetical protein
MMTPSPSKNRSSSKGSQLITISELPELHEDGSKSADLRQRGRLFKNRFESQNGKNEGNLTS